MQYKCVPAPKEIEVGRDGDYNRAVRSFADLINRETYGGWEFHSMENIVVYQKPGCLASLLGQKASYVNFNMLVFSKTETNSTMTDAHIVNTKQEVNSVRKQVLSQQEVNSVRKQVLSHNKGEIPSEYISSEPKINAIYDAVITRVAGFGAAAEYLLGKEGMIAMTEITNEKITRTDDVLQIGDKVRVKLIGFEANGIAKLSIKALM
jgi:exosome complex RNA-binding protein Csl4